MLPPLDILDFLPFLPFRVTAAVVGLKPSALGWWGKSFTIVLPLEDILEFLLFSLLLVTAAVAGLKPSALRWRGKFLTTVPQLVAGLKFFCYFLYPGNSGSGWAQTLSLGMMRWVSTTVLPLPDILEFLLFSILQRQRQRMDSNHWPWVNEGSIPPLCHR